MKTNLECAAPALLAALERIARPHDCGCKPCTGDCVSQTALQITVDEIRDLARAAIAAARQPEIDPVSGLPVNLDKGERQ